MGFKTDSYRPELHYMRGPGPKWHEKNGMPMSLPVHRSLQPLAAIWLIPAAAAVLLAVVTALAFA
ncbi:MAG TPA: hypothetical protein VFR71_08440 [Methyloceanibacter sp.]|jgi:hypothetical protein|nr:hypothetical protein [Methyloceanibacter sp.]